MATTSTKARTQSPPFEPLAQRLKAWRAHSTRRRGIPEELWQAAAELARVQGLNRAAAELKLNYCDLQRRMGGGARIRRRAKPTPHFVEAAAPVAAAVGEQGTLELVQSWGRLTLRLPNARLKELLAIVQAFVRRRS